MAGTGPQIPTTPLELLTDQGYVKPPYLNDTWGYIVGGVLGLTGTLYTAYASRRPLTSGLHWTIGATIVGAMAGNYMDNLKKQYDADRDAMLRHYVQLHPEDFPAFERKKYADVLDPWYPIRS